MEKIEREREKFLSSNETTRGHPEYILDDPHIHQGIGKAQGFFKQATVTLWNSLGRDLATAARLDNFQGIKS